MIGIKEILRNKSKLKSITEAAFKTVDTDGSGYLEKNELEQIMINVANDIGVEKPSK